MTTLAKLLAEKQQLIERLEKNSGPQEREEIERLLAKINAAQNLLDEAGPADRHPARGWGSVFDNHAFLGTSCLGKLNVCSTEFDVAAAWNRRGKRNTDGGRDAATDAKNEASPLVRFQAATGKWGGQGAKPWV